MCTREMSLLRQSELIVVHRSFVNVLPTVCQPLRCLRLRVLRFSNRWPTVWQPTVVHITFFQPKANYLLSSANVYPTVHLITNVLPTDCQHVCASWDVTPKSLTFKRMSLNSATTGFNHLKKQGGGV